MRRRWILWVLIIAFVWLVITRFTEIQKLLDVLAQGQWEWVLAAALLQALFFVVYAALYQAAFHTVEVESRVSELIPVLLSAWFLTVVAPSGGASTAALFADDAARRGQSPVRAAAGTVLVLLADFSSFVVILAIGLLYLFGQHSLQLYHVLGSLVLFCFIGALAGLLLMGVWQPDRLRYFLHWMQQAANALARQLRRPAWLPEGWADRVADEAIDASLAMVTYPQRLMRTMAVALMAHLVNLASLYTLFRAFQEPIQFGPLVAGFAVGELFLVVSPTPMGIGVMEGVMVLVYNSLGIATEKAAVVTLAFRGLSLWLPLFIGFFLLRRVKSFGAEEYSRAEVSSVRAVALLTALMGLVNMVSAFTPSGVARLLLVERFSPLGVTYGGHLLVALAGFALLLLAWGLWHRKRLAWFLTLVTLDASIVCHLLKGLDYEEAIAAGALAAWLFFLYPHFHAKLQPPTFKQGMVTLAVAILYTLAYGTLGYFYLDVDFNVDLGLDTALWQTLVTLGSFGGVEDLLPSTSFAEYFASSVRLVGVTTLLYALFVMIRPLFVTPPATPSERRRAAQTVQMYGRTPLAQLALLDDKSYFFDFDGMMIPYVVRGRIALALGDPIGPSQNVAETVRAFRTWCLSNRWHPAFYQARAVFLEQYQTAGLYPLPIAQEALVELASFDLAADASNTLRLPVTRLASLGYRYEVVQPPLSRHTLQELAAVSDEWLITVQSSERSFSVGWFDEKYLRTTPVVIVRTPEGFVIAFANLLGSCDHSEIGVDMVRHRRDVPGGLLEYLFTHMVQWAKEEGYRYFNMGSVALDPGQGELEGMETSWTQHYLREHIAQVYRYKGSRSFKEKFRPRWSLLYLVYPPEVSLALVTMAIIRADAGTGLVRGYVRGLPRPVHFKP
ncbi:MAG: flippase-like domain-containing protein, partial [Anaerolineae bacterium]|nr:flippase-like domain-containing protein [Anaerolineae bacterium]